MSIRRTWLAASVAMWIAAPVMALDIVPTWDNGVHTWTDSEKAVVEHAILEWEGAINMPGTVDIGFGWEHAGGAYAGVTYMWDWSAPAGIDLYPWTDVIGHFIAFNADIGWYVDPVPTTDGEGFGGYDLLNVARHELGHALGHQSGIWIDDLWTGSHTDRWEAQITGNTFDLGGLNVAMSSGDHSHVSSGSELMNPVVWPGARHDISETIRAMLNKAHGYDMWPDFNQDLYVDATDLAIFKAHFGQSGRTWSQGDANFDGWVDATDLAIFKASFGFDGTGAESIPEPTVMALFAVPVALAVLGKRRR